MSVSIKVAIRCRPFTVDDKLGVKMRQTDEEAGEVELINCEYTTKRFPFTYSWWSAYGYKRHLIGEHSDTFFSAFGQCDAILYDLALDQVLSVFSSIILMLTKFVLYCYCYCYCYIQVIICQTEITWNLLTRCLHTINVD